MNAFEARTVSEHLGMFFARNLFMPLQFKSALIVFALVTLGCALPCLGQNPQQTPVPPPGSISGTVVDGSGAVIAGARVRLTREEQSAKDQSPSQEALSGNDGQFS